MTSDFHQADKLITQKYTDLGEFKGFWQTSQTLCEFATGHSESQATSIKPE